MLTSLISGREVLSPEDLSCDAAETICITGHREKSIEPYRDERIYASMTVSAVKLMLYRFIDMAAEHGYKNFINGLAVGTDLWAAEYILEKKKHSPGLRLIGAMPYLRHAEHFPAYYKELLNKVENGADALISVSSDPNAFYSKTAAGKYLYRDRNYFMVDHSSAVIAFHNKGSAFSGTSQTVNYACRKGVRVCRFGIDDVYRMIDSCGTDIRKIKRGITFLENEFDLPY